MPKPEKPQTYLTDCDALQLSRMDGVLSIDTSDGKTFCCFLNEEGAEKLLKAVRSFLEDENQMFNEDGTARNQSRGE